MSKSISQTVSESISEMYLRNYVSKICQKVRKPFNKTSDKLLCKLSGNGAVCPTLKNWPKIEWKINFKNIIKK